MARVEVVIVTDGATEQATAAVTASKVATDGDGAGVEVNR